MDPSMQLLLWLTILATLFTWAVDMIIFFDLYGMAPTEKLRTALKWKYLPTWYNHYYRSHELAALGDAFADAWSTGHRRWVFSSLYVTLLARNFMPITGVYYVEVLTGRAMGFLMGLVTTWSAETLSAMIIWCGRGLLLNDELDLHQLTCFWDHLMEFLNVILEKLAPRVLNRKPAKWTLALITLILGRCFSPFPSWATNVLIIILGVPKYEFLLSAALAAVPHLLVSVSIGNWQLYSSPWYDTTGMAALLVNCALFLLAFAALRMVVMKRCTHRLVALRSFGRRVTVGESHDVQRSERYHQQRLGDYVHLTFT